MIIKPTHTDIHRNETPLLLHAAPITSDIRHLVARTMHPLSDTHDLRDHKNIPASPTLSKRRPAQYTNLTTHPMPGTSPQGHASGGRRFHKYYKIYQIKKYEKNYFSHYFCIFYLLFLATIRFLLLLQITILIKKKNIRLPHHLQGGVMHK